MAASVGTIFLDVQLNTNSINSQLQQIKNQAGSINFSSGNSSLKSMVSNINSFAQSTRNSTTASVGLTEQLNNTAVATMQVKERFKDANGHIVTICKTLKNSASHTNKMQQSLKNTNTIANSFKNTIKQSNSATLGLNNSFSLVNSTVAMLKRNFLYFFSIYRLLNFASESLDLGSGLVEDEHLLDITLGNMSQNMKDYIKTLKATTGMAQAEATKLASGFTKAFKAMGMGNEQNNAFTQELMQKMGDVASAYNLSYEKTYEKFMSAIVGGNARSGRELGISILVQDMQAYMESIGDTRSYNSLSSYEKMLLRYQKTMKDLDFTTGDFVKTQHTWTNQTRILSSTWNNFKTIIGQNLIMILTPVLEMVNKLVSAFESLAIRVNEFFKGLGWESRLGNAGIGESVSEYTDSIEDANDSIANSASGAAKKISRALMGFDKVNKLTSSSSSGSGASSGSGLDFSTNNVTDSIEGTTNILDGITNKVKELKQLFENGFKFSFKADINQLYENIKSIKDSLGTLFSNEDIQSAANLFSRSFIEYLGSISGTFASVGVSIATWITGSIAQSLAENGGGIKTWFLDVSENATRTISDLQEYNRTISDIFTVLEGKNAQSFLSNLITIVGNTFGTITGLCIRLQSDIVRFLTKPINDNVEGIKQVLDNLLGGFANITSGMSTFIATLGSNLIALYDEHIRPLFDALTESVSEWIGIITSGYNEYIAPVIDKLSAKSQELWEKLSPIIENLKGILGDLIDIIKIAWKTYLSPLVSWFLSKLMPVLGFLLDVLGSIGLYIGGAFIDALNFAIGIIKSFTSFIKDLVQITSDVVTKFTDMKDGIVGAFESIPNAIKNAINSCIGFINNMINGINKFEINVPNPFGEDYSYAPNIPNIPQLANGGYVKAGQGGVLAQIGEGRYGEVVTNDKQRKLDNDYVVNKVEQLIDSKLSNMNSGGTLQPVIFQIGDVEVASVLIDILKGEIKRTGVSLV